MGKKRKYESFKYIQEDARSKKKKKSKYDQPKLKTLSSSLDKKERKECYSILNIPIEVPKKFTKIRNKCNHVNRVITVAEYKAITPFYAVFTPMLDAMVAKYGEENIRVCSSCFDVLVSPNLVKGEDLRNAVSSLYSAANTLMITTRVKKGEIRDLNELKSSLSDWNEVIAQISELERNGNLKMTFGQEGNEDTSGSSMDDDLSALNRMSSAIQTY